MGILRQIHDFIFNTAWAFLFPTPLALVTLVLFIWSLGPFLKGYIGLGFMVWLRLTWFCFFVYAISGIVLALGGLKVPSATNMGNGLSKYDHPVDPSRDWEHWMYAFFTLLSLYVIEYIVKNKTPQKTALYKALPVVTLFLYGVVYMIGRVAVYPGSTPGT